MRTLLLMRHAKSSWRDVGLDDHDRPLNGRGRRSAPYMGELLRARGLVPELILCSTAVRAVETASEVIKSTEFDGSLEVRRGLYLAEPTAYLDALTEVPSGHDRVLIIGHNPGISELLGLLTGEELDMPTAAIAEVAFEVGEVSEIGPSSRGRLVSYFRPPKDDKLDADTDRPPLAEKRPLPVEKRPKKAEADKKADEKKAEADKKADEKKADADKKADEKKAEAEKKADEKKRDPKRRKPK